MDKQDNVITKPLTSNEIDEIEIIELLFFAYRDFVRDPDRMLEDQQFGRAHHRVLYFVNRTPSMTVADLLQILGITKQSLARVLKQLINSGYIIQIAGKTDRRQRLLYPTKSGRQLIQALSTPQSRRINKAFKNLNSADRLKVVSFLKAMRE